MRRESEKYLRDALDCAEFLRQFVDGRSIEDLRDDRAFRSAIERELTIIGEAFFQLRNSDAEEAERIPEVHRIIAF